MQTQRRRFPSWAILAILATLVTAPGVTWWEARGEEACCGRRQANPDRGNSPKGGKHENTTSSGTNCTCVLYRWANHGTYCSYYAMTCDIAGGVSYHNVDLPDCTLTAGNCQNGQCTPPNCFPSSSFRMAEEGLDQPQPIDRAPGFTFPKEDQAHSLYVHFDSPVETGKRIDARVFLVQVQSRAVFGDPRVLPERTFAIGWQIEGAGPQSQAATILQVTGAHTVKLLIDGQDYDVVTADRLQAESP